MGLIVFLIILGLIAGMIMEGIENGSNEFKLIIFMTGIAILAAIASTIVPFMMSVARGAVLVILCAFGYLLYKKLFR